MTGRLSVSGWLPDWSFGLVTRKQTSARQNKRIPLAQDTKGAIVPRGTAGPPWYNWPPGLIGRLVSGWLPSQSLGLATKKEKQAPGKTKNLPWQADTKTTNCTGGDRRSPLVQFAWAKRKELLSYLPRPVVPGGTANPHWCNRKKELLYRGGSPVPPGTIALGW